MIILKGIVFGLASMLILYTIVNFILGFLGVKVQIKIKFLYKGNNPL